jgi:hypothetical protein
LLIAMTRIVVPLLSSARAPLVLTGPNPRSPVRRTTGREFDIVVELFSAPGRPSPMAARAQHAAGRMLMRVIDLAHVEAAQRDGECVGHADGCCHLPGWCGRRSGPRVRAGTR